METRNRIRGGCAIFFIACGFVAGVAAEQSQPPSTWDVLENGVPIPTQDLKAHFAAASGVFDIGRYAAGTGFAFNCREDDPVIWFFDGGIGRREEVDCYVDGSRLCFGDGADAECMELWTLPGGKEYSSRLSLVPRRCPRIKSLS